MKTRIAYFGPLNPIPSGISDYDEELLPLLRQHYDIDVFHNFVINRPNVYPHSDFLIRNRRNPYDLNLYQLGNALIHEMMYGYLFQFPGAVVFHDLCLHHSRAKMLLQRGLFDEYRDEAKYAHPEAPVVSELVATGMGSDLLLYSFPFLKLVAQNSLAAGTHTDWGVSELQRFGITAIKIPMAVSVDYGKDISGTDVTTLASFGFVTPEKRISIVLRVLHELRLFYPKIQYKIVGEIAEHYDLHKEITELHLEDVVELKGRTTKDQFHQEMKNADVVINLRYPSAREMSATLLRAMALGKPVLMSRLKHLMEIPADAAIKIRPDNEKAELFHHLWQLIEDPGLRTRIGNNARNYMQAHHRPDQMVEKYRELIETALESKKTFRPPKLPTHLADKHEMLRAYIKRTVFANRESNLLNYLSEESK
jgi:glycosyltransferase involved in cell wall biosynthesis